MRLVSSQSLQLSDYHTFPAPQTNFYTHIPRCVILRFVKESHLFLHTTGQIRYQPKASFVQSSSAKDTGVYQLFD